MEKDFVQFSQNLSPEIYQSLKQSLELGKWPDGKPLSPEQRETCMQAIISYEALHVAEEDRAGYLGQTCKSQAGEPSSDAVVGNGEVNYYGNGEQSE